MSWPEEYTRPADVGDYERTSWGHRARVRVHVWAALVPKDPSVPPSRGVRGFIALTGSDRLPQRSEASEAWLREARNLRRMQEVFQEQLIDLIHAERHVGDGWTDLAEQVLGDMPPPEESGWPAFYSKLALRRDVTGEGGAPSVSVRGWWARGPSGVTPFGVAAELLPLFQALAAEGAVLDDPQCQDMLAEAPENLGVPRLGITPAEVEELADEIMSSRSWDRAYQRSVCRYLLALDAVTKTAEEFIAWIDEWGDEEIREHPDWYKLLLVREI